MGWRQLRSEKAVGPSKFVGKAIRPSIALLRRRLRPHDGAANEERRWLGGVKAPDVRVLKDTTLAHLVRRYLVEVTPTKRGAESEGLRLSKLLNAPLCETPLYTLSAAPIAAFRDNRLEEVRPATVIRELGLLRSVVEVARRDCCFEISANPFALVRRVSAGDGRDRRLRPGEMKGLLNALKGTIKALIKPAVLLAIETGMRRGEPGANLGCHRP